MNKPLLLVLTLAFVPCSFLLAGCPDEAKPDAADAAPTPPRAASASAALSASAAPTPAVSPDASAPIDAGPAADAGSATDAGKDAGKPPAKK